MRTVSILMLPERRWWRNPPPDEIMRDQESLLRYELSLVQRAYQDEVAPLAEELVYYENLRLALHPITVTFDDLPQSVKDLLNEKLSEYAK